MLYNPVITNYSWYEDAKHYEDDWSYKDDPKGKVLMQFTGLFDKQGVEIYEGDIVQQSYTRSQGGWYKRKPLMEVKIEEIETDYGNFLGWSIPIPEDDLRYEVIGNVYDNPNLLK